VEITATRSSCDCFGIQLESDYLEPGQQIRATLTLDLKDDPFTGDLSLELIGRAKSQDTPAFLIRARVKVKPRPGKAESA
jgi:hypothetical protein